MAPLFAMLSEDELQAAEVLGKAMRFGAMFSIRDPSEAGSLKLSLKKKTLTLTLTKTGRALFGEVALARFQSLCKSLGVEGVVKG